MQILSIGAGLAMGGDLLSHTWWQDSRLWLGEIADSGDAGKNIFQSVSEKCFP